MDKYVPENMLYSLLANNHLLLFCPPWASMRCKARGKDLHSRLLYRFGFRRRHLGEESPSLNSKWAELSIYHNKLLPNDEMCIIHMPQKPAVVTYIDVLHRNTLKLWSFIHIPDRPVTTSNSYTPFPHLEKTRAISGESFIRSGVFDIAKAVETDVAMHVSQDFDTLVDTSPNTVFPLQGTLDGYFWKSVSHWLTTEPQLKQFHAEDHIFVLTGVVLEIRNAVLSCFCRIAESSDTICEVFFRDDNSSLVRNIRTVPEQSLAEMQGLVIDANESLTIKALMSTNKPNDEYCQPLEMVVCDPWLLFTMRTVLPPNSALFHFLQNSERLQPVEKPIVFTVRETFNMSEPSINYMRVWTDVAVDISSEKHGPEGIPLVTITSPVVQQMDSDGTLGTHLKECGGIASTHAQNEHTTTIFLMNDRALIYDDTLPFLIKSCQWNKGQLASMLDDPMIQLQHLLCDSYSFRDECQTENL